MENAGQEMAVMDSRSGQEVRSDNKQTRSASKAGQEAYPDSRNTHIKRGPGCKNYSTGVYL